MKSNPETKHHIGEIFQLSEDFAVQTNLGLIIIEEIQIEGKSNLPIREFIKGYSNFVGSILK